ncbi:MAG: hypothetical protein EOO45_17520 [Flavobacterium sp.]|nr:MAG: hypothetical protein EOO45_17520 [Flavobacterium sp.]
MGRLKNGINGHFTGKVGTVVGVSSKGVDFIKSKQRKTTKKPSKAQLNQRDRLSLFSSWLRAIKEIITIGFQNSANAKKVNAAISYNMKNALIVVDGQNKIDFSKAIFSKGSLIISIIVEVVSLIDALLKIKWTNAATSSLNKDNDVATIILYNPAKDSFLTFENVAQRGDLEVALSLPATFKDDKVHCYMQYVNEAGDEVSTTVYAGEIVVA